jgi:hypothetical protein
MQAAMPIMSKYVTEWKERMQKDVKDMGDGTPQKKVIQLKTVPVPTPNPQ